MYMHKHRETERLSLVWSRRPAECYYSLYSWCWCYNWAESTGVGLFPPHWHPLTFISDGSFLSHPLSLTVWLLLLRSVSLSCLCFLYIYPLPSFVCHLMINDTCLVFTCLIRCGIELSLLLLDALLLSTLSPFFLFPPNLPLFPCDLWIFRHCTLDPFSERLKKRHTCDTWALHQRPVEKKQSQTEKQRESITVSLITHTEHKTRRRVTVLCKLAEHLLLLLIIILTASERKRE